MQFPWGLGDKESDCNAGDAGYTGFLPGSGRCPGERNGNPFQYFCLGNSMGREAWRVMVHGVAESDTTETSEHEHTFLHTRKQGRYQ